MKIQLLQGEGSRICAKRKENLHLLKELRNTILPFTNKLGPNTTFNDFQHFISVIDIYWYTEIKTSLVRKIDMTLIYHTAKIILLI